jgi:hypothetical protein
MLSDLAVFTEYAVAASTQVVAQQVALFNEAAQGTFILRASNHSGDFSEFAFYKRLSGLVRRRNAYGQGNIPEINFAMIVENMVKIAAGTPAVRLDPGQFKWIQQDPATRGAAMGQQLGQDMVRDMFNTGLGGLVASHSTVAGLIVDKTTDGDGRLQLPHFNAAQAKYGDRWRDLQAWVMHSSAMFALWDKVFANAERLFTFGELNVMRDPFGRPFIVSDAPGLVIPAAGADPARLLTLGVKPGAVVVDQNNDFTDNFDNKNGQENIVTTYQAEWSYNLGVRGFAWDKAAGGKSPTDAALLSGANWDRVDGYNDRDLACVMIKNNQ